MDDTFFRAVVESLGDGVLVVRDGTVTYWNAALAGLLNIQEIGVRLSNWVGELLCADDSARPLGIDELPPMIAARGNASHREAILRRTGVRVSFSARPLKNADGKTLGSVSLVRDVTDQRRAEDELARTRKFIDSIVENIPDMVFVKDADELRFERFNRAGEELLGIPRAQLLGKTDHDFFPPDQAAFFQKRDRETLRAGRLVDVLEEPIDTARGRRWLHTKKIPILDEKGSPKYLLGISSDITDKRRAEEALKQAHEELERRVEQRTAELHAAEEQLRHAQKLEAVGRLAGGVAHDFNNVLAVILGDVAMLSRSLPERDPARQGLESIRTAAEHAATLTRQLLAFSRKQVMRPRLLNLNRVVEQAQGMLGRLLGEDISLEVRLSPEIGSIHADPALLEQVIVNLAVNARDAMPSGGSLVIETARYVVGSGDSGPPGLVPGTYVRLRVTDSGVGMSDETRARVFEPFFTTKGPGKGTGLGLSMAYGVVVQSGGAIAVDSEVGRGTSFSVYLPIDGKRSETPAPFQGPFVDGGGETILIAEDEARLRPVLRSILERAGYRVLLAATGADALVVAAEHDGPIDLLLSDVVMPVMDGPELARRLVEVRPTVRVLFMSGYPDDRLSAHHLARSGIEALAKPFSAEVLTARVRAALDGRSGDVADDR